MCGASPALTLGLSCSFSPGDRIGAVVISSDARWADGLRDFMEDEYPEIDRIVLAA